MLVQLEGLKYVEYGNTAGDNLNTKDMRIRIYGSKREKYATL